MGALLAIPLLLLLASVVTLMGVLALVTYVATWWWQPVVAGICVWTIAFIGTLCLVGAFSIFRYTAPLIRNEKWQRRVENIQHIGICADCGLCKRLSPDPNDYGLYCQDCNSFESQLQRFYRQKLINQRSLQRLVDQKVRAGECAYLPAWYHCTRPLRPGSLRCDLHNRSCANCARPAVWECSWHETPTCLSHTCRGFHYGDSTRELFESATNNKKYAALLAEVQSSIT